MYLGYIKYSTPINVYHQKNIITGITLRRTNKGFPLKYNTYLKMYKHYKKSSKHPGSTCFSNWDILNHWNVKQFTKR